MKYLAMFLEILGSALFTLIGFCVICGILFLIVYSLVSIAKGINRDESYVEKLKRETFEKYTFKLGDKEFWKDKWDNL